MTETNFEMDVECEIDDSQYSRQRYVLGDVAMKKMAKSHILLVGLGGVGIEIAKNIALAGVKSLTLQDGNSCSIQDLAGQFFITENDIAKNLNRATASKTILAELNPYVALDVIDSDLTCESDFSYLDKFNCVILTECSLNVQIMVNEYFRSKNMPIKFISCDIFGVFSTIFCDFGNGFEVNDIDGEECIETFVGNIIQGKETIIECLEELKHGLEDGDFVTFKEIKGMEQLNGNSFKIKVINPGVISIGDTTHMGKYISDGIMKKIKISKTIEFESLFSQLKSPSFLISDYCKLDMMHTLHFFSIVLHQFVEEHKRFPKAWDVEDSEIFLSLSHVLNKAYKFDVKDILLKKLAMTCSGCLTPLCAAVGGIVGQEVLKAVTGKFMPLRQWLFLDSIETLRDDLLENPIKFQENGDRYDKLRICIGEKIHEEIKKLKLFMVGCGAIGCEMLKNYALLGLGTDSNGLITITDDDLIEKSNLNRQFLFRPKHIRQPKSIIAAESVKQINKDIRINADQLRVCPQTENVYTDVFISKQNIIVNALDNLSARRYVDSRCVSNQRPLLESGTMGPKGHVQVIVPFKTESYSSQQDPIDNDIPYCTLKSFPQNIDHCIQWAREKFQSSFFIKTSMYNKFFQDNPDLSITINKLKQGSSIDNAVTTSKLINLQPKNWKECLIIARLKFEKYFNHRAKQLLHSFPLDTKMKDGSNFWQSPKRPPTPIQFDFNDNNHLLFVISCARLYADCYQVQYDNTYKNREVVIGCLENVDIPPFKPSGKSIEISEDASKPNTILDEDEISQSAISISKCINTDTASSIPKSLQTLEFEKDDDNNGHIDFISSASNLRAQMYRIESTDRLEIKRIAGKIVPAIATTTAAVAGLVTIELIKLIKNVPLENYRNCFLNLALPIFVLSEPGEASKKKLSCGLEFTLWDRLELKGNKDFTLNNLIEQFRQKHNLEINMVIQGSKMIYMPYMPLHKKRLNEPILKYLKTGEGNYVDLLISFDTADPDSEAPPLRYYFK